MITFSICISLVILAVIAAIFSSRSSDWVLPADRNLYFPPFFKSEGFYRAVLINLRLRRYLDGRGRDSVREVFHLLDDL